MDGPQSELRERRILINFPVQALGFANVNAFKVRWINVPEFGSEGCSTNAFGIGGNTFSVTLYDDGTGIDENANQPLNPANPIGQQCSAVRPAGRADRSSVHSRAERRE